MPYAELAQGTIHYADDGPRDAPVVVLVHGALVDGRLWREVVPLLALEHRVVVPDLPLGCHRIGLAPGADRTPEGVADLLADLLDHLELEDVLIAGSDSGGALTQLLVTRRPERIGRVALVSCDAFGNSPPGPFGIFPAVCRFPSVLRAVLQTTRSKRALRLPLGFGWLAKHGVPEDLLEDWGRLMRAGGAPLQDVAAFGRTFRPATTLDVLPALERLELPVLLLWAREDKLFPPAHAERFAALLPDATLRWVEDSYAFVMLDQPGVTARELAAFAQAKTGSSPAGMAPAGS